MKSLYVTSYYLSYGVVFGAVYLAHRVPSDNAIVYGMRDGARAAYRHALRQEAERAAHQAEDQRGTGDAAAASQTA